MYTNIVSYLIHDNRDIPYSVLIDKKDKVVRIYKNKEIYDKDEEDFFVTAVDFELLKLKNVDKVFIGKSVKSKFTTLYGKEVDGNSILIKPEKSKNNYIFVGNGIRSFSTPEPILYFLSPIGNNDVPYPYAISKNYIYLLEEEEEVITLSNKYFNSETVKKYIKGTEYPYEWYDNNWKIETVKIATKIIHEREFM